MRAVGDETQLVSAQAAPGDGGREHERGIVGAVDGDLEKRGLRFVEELVDVDPGEPCRHESERGERRIAPSHVGVRVEDAVARFASGGVQGRSGVGDNHDPLVRVDAQVAEGGLEGATGRVGLDRGTRFGGDHQDGAVQAAR